MIDIDDITTINVLQIASTHILSYPYKSTAIASAKECFLLIVMADGREIESRPASLEKTKRLRADIKSRFDALVMNRHVTY